MSENQMTILKSLLMFYFVIKQNKSGTIVDLILILDET